MAIRQQPQEINNWTVAVVDLFSTSSPSSTVPVLSDAACANPMLSNPPSPTVFKPPTVKNSIFRLTRTASCSLVQTNKYRTPSVFSDTRYSELLITPRCRRLSATGFVPEAAPVTCSLYICITLPSGLCLFVYVGLAVCLSPFLWYQFFLSSALPRPCVVSHQETCQMETCDSWYRQMLP